VLFRTTFWMVTSKWMSARGRGGEVGRWCPHPPGANHAVLTGSIAQRFELNGHGHSVAGERHGRVRKIGVGGLNDQRGPGRERNITGRRPLRTPRARWAAALRSCRRRPRSHWRVPGSRCRDVAAAHVARLGIQQPASVADGGVHFPVVFDIRSQWRGPTRPMARTELAEASAPSGEVAGPVLGGEMIELQVATDHQGRRL
jgi:hypothetical protein